MASDIKQVLERATARPWTVEGGDGCPLYITEAGGQRYGVAMMDGVLEQRSVNAQLIVAAVNSFESNRELIRELAEVLTRLHAISGEANIPLTTSKAVRQMGEFLAAREQSAAALAKVREAGL